MKKLVVCLAIVLLTRSVYAQIGACAVPTGPLLPDLIAEKPANPIINTKTFDVGDCNIDDGCIVGPGTYTLLWFDAATTNTGKTDMVIGDPAQCPQLFEFSACHGHYHIHGYAAYRLWTVSGWKQWVTSRDLSQPITGTANAVLLDVLAAGGAFVSGHKQGFCMEDMACGHIDASGPSTGGLFGAACWTDGKGWARHPTNKFTCRNQGLTVGWTDAYFGWDDRYQDGLDGQFIVLDGLVPGKYILEVQINPDHLLPESDYTNNSAYLAVTIK